MQVTKVVKAIRHAAYEPVDLNNDIMLLRLDPPAILGGRVKPIPLAQQCVPFGTKCMISGWGSTSFPEGKAKGPEAPSSHLWPA